MNPSSATGNPITIAEGQSCLESIETDKPIVILGAYKGNISGTSPSIKIGAQGHVIGHIQTSAEASKVCIYGQQQDGNITAGQSVEVLASQANGNLVPATTSGTLYVTASDGLAKITGRHIGNISANRVEILREKVTLTENNDTIEKPFPPTSPKNKSLLISIGEVTGNIKAEAVFLTGTLNGNISANEIEIIKADPAQPSPEMRGNLEVINDYGQITLQPPEDIEEARAFCRAISSIKFIRPHGLIKIRCDVQDFRRGQPWITAVTSALKNQTKGKDVQYEISFPENDSQFYTFRKSPVKPSTISYHLSQRSHPKRPNKVH